MKSVFVVYAGLSVTVTMLVVMDIFVKIEFASKDVEVIMLVVII